MSLKSRILTSFRETFRTILSPLTLFVAGVSVVLATISAPFGTFAMDAWPMRGAYWLLLVSASVLAGYSVRALALALVGPERPIALDALIVVLATVVLAPFISLVTRAWFSVPGFGIEPLPVVALYVMLCASAIVVARRLSPGFEAGTYDFLADAEPALPDYGQKGEPRLNRRLSPDVRGNILRLTANDHFVEVATDNGAQSLRMRLTDAIDEMEPVEGYCVHRSHWVAHGAIVSVERENASKIFVVLSNNDRIPVSRKYRVNLETAGLI